VLYAIKKAYKTTKNHYKTTTKPLQNHYKSTQNHTNGREKGKKSTLHNLLCSVRGDTPSPATKASNSTPPRQMAQNALGDPFTPLKIIFQNFGKTFFLLTIDYQQVSKFI
jgi:hypothetical protein